MDDEDTSPIDKKWKPHKCSSLRLGRSRSSSTLFSESIPSESAQLTSYQRLSSESPVHVGIENRKKNDKKSKALMGFISKVFSLRRSNGGDEIIGQANTVNLDDPAAVVAVEKKKRRWLPDPNRRWPVQGW